LKGHIAYLIEEDRAFIRKLELAVLFLGSAGKCAFFMAE